MIRYIFYRILQSIVTLFMVTIVVFIITRLSGDPSRLLLPIQATQVERDAFREKYGLNEPLHKQYWIFLKNSAQGDFGKSLRWHEPAMSLVISRVPATFELASASIIFATILGVSVGVLSAVKPKSIMDNLGRLFALFGQATPPFWVGIMLILILSVRLNLLPTSGRGSIIQIIMPSITLGWFSTAAIMRLTRSSMLDALNSDYIRMARIKGVTEFMVVMKHAFKNASIPIVTMISLQFGGMLGGAVVTESIFAWPGMGRLAVEAIYSRDFPVVQASVIVASTMFILINLFVDILYSLIDPRIRYYDQTGTP